MRSLNKNYIYDNFPKTVIAVPHGIDFTNFSIISSLSEIKGRVISVELYPGIDKSAIFNDILKNISVDIFVDIEQYKKPQTQLDMLLEPYLTDDRVFGKMNGLSIEDLYDMNLVNALIEEIKDSSKRYLVYGFGASMVPYDNLVYADITRWEIQLRFRKGMTNFTADNSTEDILRKFKRGYFVEWRIADNIKKVHFEKADYYIDANKPGSLTMISFDAYKIGLDLLAASPFRLIPYYDPGVWGGQWMKKVCHLDPNEENYAWSINGIPEENSLCFSIQGHDFEFPAINLVFFRSVKLLGKAVYDMFGAEFPIRFDFLDTMGGGNLSLQVHPTKDYISKTFGMKYTQDESYYILDAKADSSVYLGLKQGTEPNALIADLIDANKGNSTFNDEKYINNFPAKKHDHFLIPAGTIHCSGKNTMVLEISSTPYIFTFKLWDWGRLGLDGQPRPVHIQHGEKVIQYNRTTEWVKKNLINRVSRISDIEEKTGLHELEFIETRRFTFSEKLETSTDGSVNVLMIVEGSGAKITPLNNPKNAIEVHYAECFIVPENVKKYSVEPLEKNERCILLKSYVRN